jgi:uncharacterized membrane protein YdbT with pleckstrin-like domain
LLRLNAMSFPERLLADNERLVFALRPHWIALVPAAAWTLLIVVGTSFAVSFLGRLNDPDIARIALVALALVAVFFLSVLPFLRWSTTNFILTTDRLITRSGIIAKHSKEIPLENINDVAFNQRILERMVGAGDLLVESAGERGQNRISNVRNPEQVQLAIYKETEENNKRMQRAGVPERDDDISIPGQLEALARLKHQGVISEAEFETKKQELLRRL